MLEGLAGVEKAGRSCRGEVSIFWPKVVRNTSATLRPA